MVLAGMHNRGQAPRFEKVDVLSNWNSFPVGSKLLVLWLSYVGEGRFIRVLLKHGLSTPCGCGGSPNGFDSLTPHLVVEKRLLFVHIGVRLPSQVMTRFERCQHLLGVLSRFLVRDLSFVHLISVARDLHLHRIPLPLWPEPKRGEFLLISFPSDFLCDGVRLLFSHPDGFLDIHLSQVLIEIEFIEQALVPLGVLYGVMNGSPTVANRVGGYLPHLAGVMVHILGLLQLRLRVLTWGLHLHDGRLAGMFGGCLACNPRGPLLLGGLPHDWEVPIIVGCLRVRILWQLIPSFHNLFLRI
jgi:hypothetical protein